MPPTTVEQACLPFELECLTFQLLTENTLQGLGAALLDQQKVVRVLRDWIEPRRLL